MQANKNPVKTIPALTGFCVQVLIYLASVASAASISARNFLTLTSFTTQVNTSIASCKPGRRGRNAVLTRSGHFATASCSHFMPSEQFMRMLRSAALDAGVELRQIEARQQAPDHPILWNVPETDYLKFYLFQVV